jgi:hypothetical protein
LGSAYSFLEQSGSLAKGERPADRYQRWLEREHAETSGVLGAAMGLLKSQAAEKHETAGARYERRMAAHKAAAAPQAKLPPISLNIDGRTLAEALSKSWYSFPTQAPAADGMSRFFGAKPEVYTKLSWNALVHLASPTLPAAARDALESRIIAGERIGAPEIREARGALKSGRPRHQPD